MKNNVQIIYILQKKTFQISFLEQLKKSNNYIIVLTAILMIKLLIKFKLFVIKMMLS